MGLQLIDSPEKHHQAQKRCQFFKPGPETKGKFWQNYYTFGRFFSTATETYGALAEIMLKANNDVAHVKALMWYHQLWMGGVALMSATIAGVIAYNFQGKFIRENVNHAIPIKQALVKAQLPQGEENSIDLEIPGYQHQSTQDFQHNNKNVEQIDFNDHAHLIPPALGVPRSGATLAKQIGVFIAYSILTLSNTFFSWSALFTHIAVAFGATPVGWGGLIAAVALSFIVRMLYAMGNELHHTLEKLVADGEQEGTFYDAWFDNTVGRSGAFARIINILGTFHHTLWESVLNLLLFVPDSAIADILKSTVNTGLFFGFGSLAALLLSIPVFNVTWNFEGRETENYYTRHHGTDNFVNTSNTWRGLNYYTAYALVPIHFAAAALGPWFFVKNFTDDWYQYLIGACAGLVIGAPSAYGTWIGDVFETHKSILGYNETKDEEDNDMATIDYPIPRPACTPCASPAA